MRLDFWEQLMVDEGLARERGTALMFIGLAVWVVGMLVLFFLPAAAKLGRHATVLAVIGGCAVLGANLMVSGFVKRSHTGSAE